MAFYSKKNDCYQVTKWIRLMLPKLALLAFFFLSTFSGFGQNSKENETWNPGYLVTSEEDTIYGPVLMNFQSDLVQVNEENMVKTFAANQIRMVFYTDLGNNEEKYFYTFRFHPYSDFKPYRFFEMVFSGVQLSLLAREMWVTESVPYVDNFTFRTYYTTQTRLAREFYFMFPKEVVKAFSGSKKELLKLLADKKDEMKKYVEANRFSLNQKEDLLKIVKEYNRLKTK